MNTPANDPGAPAFARAKASFLEGLRRHHEGDLEGAVRCYLASLEDLPGRPSTLTNLAAARLVLGQPALALHDARAALDSEAGNREAMRHEATALAELGATDEALAAFRRVVALDPDLHSAWMAMGNLLIEKKEFEDAAQAFQTAMNNGADPEAARFHLAAARAGSAEPAATAAHAGGAAPAAPPRAYVEALFDRYAADFDHHLVDQLGYEAPQRLVDRLPSARDGHTRGFARALDLGCGTGLCAPLLHGRVDRLVGVDLSARMLEHARARGLYHRLDQADIGEWLTTCDERFDLVVAADVFIYVGALDAVFAGVARVLDAGGVFAFSIERTDDADDDATARDDAAAQRYELRPSLRYAHTLAYVSALSQRHGMTVTAAHAGPLRRDRDGVVEGNYVFLTR